MITPAPMLASQMIEALTGPAFDARYAGWVLEEKLDGHRVTLRVEGGAIAAFSRPGRSKTALSRTLPPTMQGTLAQLTEGVYDGELVVPGGHAWDVIRKGASLVVVLFDVLELGRTSLLAWPYASRRTALLDVLARLPATQTTVTTVESVPATWAAVEAIWQRGGEGAVLKQPTSRYRPGARSADWVKVKQQRHATLTVTGFEAGESGPCSAFLLRDDQGVVTTAKVLGHALLREVTAAPAAFIGRRVVISYQQRTPSGTYRHGQFDHFLDEAR